MNRWAQLQELATANDTLLEHTRPWPRVRQGDDIAGGQPLRLLRPRCPAAPTPTSPASSAWPCRSRPGASPLGDADGDGRLDIAVARQWDAPAFYRNDSPGTGSQLSLQPEPAAGRRRRHAAPR